MLLKARLETELSSLLTSTILRLGTAIGEKVLRLEGREYFQSIFEYLACHLLSLKLHHGLSDNSTTFLDKVQDHLGCSKQSQPPAWRVKDLVRVVDVRGQIKFAEESIWPK